jgi:hypothetical protein
MVGNKLGCYRTFSFVFPFVITLIIYLYRYLYILYLAIDGNFKLKGKERNINDVELMPGLGAYVTETDYKSHIANHVDQPEVRFTSPSCSIK